MIHMKSMERKFRISVGLMICLTLTIISNSCIANPSLSIREAHFELTLAITPEEHAKGLMQQTHLNEQQGMLFIYQQPQHLSFWMKNTKIPLDILFFDEAGQLLEIHKEIPPCAKTPCKTYENKHPAQYILEIRGGLSDKHHLKPGDVFELDFK